MKRLLLLGIVSCIVVSAYSQSFNDRKTNINASWQYLENNAKSPGAIHDANGWETLDLPHTWNNLDATDLTPGYRRSASWYKKSLNLDANQDTRYFLYFEGANIVTDVYVNQKHAGNHVGGYVGFEIEITDLINDGRNNVLVRVDNGYNPRIIPSQQSDFFIYGGLTRDVWLKQVSRTFIEDLTIQTPEVSAEKAQTSIEIDIDGIEGSGNLFLEIEAVNPDGKKVYAKRSKVGSKHEAFKFSVDQPDLWDVDDPQLYSIQATLFEGKKPIDQVNDRYGYRWVEFKEHGPFYLNGERLLLRGTHRHEESAGVGAAMSNAMHRADIKAIKEMGANYVRLAHYPQDPEIYKACDELGLLVWDELPWCRGGIGDDTWKANTKNLLREMIDQNYNHPSIILWSLGNEIYWLPEFENGGDPEQINPFLKELNHIAHEMDPYRNTSIRKYYEGAHIVDVFSPSIWSGWYSGTYDNYAAAVENSLEQYPHFVHMEYGGASHVGRHTESPITGDGFVNPDEWEESINQVEVANIAKNGDWSENYIVDLFDWHLRISETHDRFIGNAQWAYRDFGTPLRPENDIPYINQKGLVDREGNPKDAYYVFKSYWSDDPFAYIESHTWTERSGPEGVKRNICVYSNADSAAFYLNDKSLGIKTRDIDEFPASGLNWDVLFKEGKNHLRAVGYFDGQEKAIDTLSVNYSYEQPGSPDELALNYKPLPNGNLLITATARDKEGRRSLDYEQRVYFQCLEGGDLKQHLGTPTGSSSIRMANGKASIEVVPHDNASKLTMTVLNQNFKGTFLEVPLNRTP